MENKKRAILIAVAVLIFILGFALIVDKLINPASQNAQPIVTTTTTPTTPAAKVTNQEEPSVTAKDEKNNLPTVEMGSAIGDVQSLTSDSLTVKTDEGTLALSIKGTFNIFAFTEKGTEQKKMSDVKTGSKVSVQYSKDKVVMSMYLMK